MIALTPEQSRELAQMIQTLTPSQRADFYYFVSVKEQDPYEFLASLNVTKHGTGDQKPHGNRYGGVSPEVASDIQRFTREWGGLSISMVDGHMPTKGYMVAKPPEFGKIVDEADFFDPIKGPKIMSQYMREQKADLATGKNYLGTWLNEGKIYLDVSENIMGRDEATRLGRERNQLKIWDVVNQVEIDTGGTGRVEKRNQDGGIEEPRRYDGRGDRRLRTRGLEKVSRERQETKVIRFAFGLKPVLKHGEHDQKDHGNWARMGYSETDATEISRMSELGPSVDELNAFLLSHEDPTSQDLIDFVNNDRGLYEQATDGIDEIVDAKMAERKYEYADQAEADRANEELRNRLYEQTQEEMIENFIANDDGTLTQIWRDSNSSNLDRSEFIMKLEEVYNMTTRGTTPNGDSVTLSSGIEGVEMTSSNSFEVTGNIYTGNGEFAGEFKREFTKNSDGTWQVEHSFLKLEDEYQGAGFGKKFLADSEAWYISRGFSSIVVGTAWDGARHWARAGFDWDFKKMGDNMNQLFDMRQNLSMYEGGKYLPEFDSLMNRMVTDYDGDFRSYSALKPITGMPTPMEFASIGYRDKKSESAEPTKDTWAGKYGMYGLHVSYRKSLKEPDSRDVQTPIDRDGDGIIFDGTPRERIAPSSGQ